MHLDGITVVRDDGMGESNPRFLFGAGSGAWRIVYEGLDGFDGLDVDIATQDYAQFDGARVTGERTAAKDRTVSALGLGDPAELRRQAETFFIPGRSYTVHVEAGERRRYAAARHYGIRIATDNMRGGQLIEWTFLCPDPYWLDEDAREYDVAEADGGFGFPFMSLSDPWELEVPESDKSDAGDAIDYLIDGFVVGVISHKIEMRNDGSATAYPSFAIEASAEVENPRVAIYDAAGNVVCQFGVAVTMEAGDLLVIDFSARPTTITLNGANVSNMATAGSTLASGIEPGDFVLEWYADGGDAAMSVVPTIRDRYVTV